MHSPQPNEVAIWMCPKASVAMCINQLNDYMIANKDPHDPLNSDQSQMLVHLDIYSDTQW